MTKYFLLSPEVAGQLGKDTVIDTTVTPPLVEKLHYEFDGWLGDDILESFPCFICTEKLAIRLKKNNIKGYLLDGVTVSKSETFIEIYPDKELPSFYWLKIVGAKDDDLILSTNGSLLVSEKALSVFRQTNINYCDFEEYHSPTKGNGFAT